MSLGQRWVTSANIAAMAEQLITSGVAARALGIDISTLNRWWRAGLIKPSFVTAGGHARWELADLRRQLQQLHTDGQS